MTDQPNTFETRLVALFDSYAAGAPVGVNAPALASEIATHDRRVVEIFGRTFVRPRWLVPAVLVLLLLAMLAISVYVGARLLQTPTRTYSEAYSTGADISLRRTTPTIASLGDGRVLVIAGQIGVAAEVYDPNTGRSELVVGRSPSGFDGSAITLPDGRVLAITFDSNSTSSRAYVFDPEAMTFGELPQEGFSNAPPFGVWPSMALLHDGRVLVAGGQRDSQRPSIRAAALIFDPATDTFTPTGSMANGRLRYSMTTMRDGRVLVAGGLQSTSTGPTPYAPPLGDAEVYDPTSGTFAPTGGLVAIRGATAGVLLPDGRAAVFAVRRPVYDGSENSATAVEIYDPATGVFTEAGSALPAHTVSPLADGRILLTGSEYVPINNNGPGEYWDLYRGWAAIYDPANGETRSIAAPRMLSAGSAVLTDGRVLFAGGIAYPPPSPDGNGSGEAFEVRWVDLFE